MKRLHSEMNTELKIHKPRYLPCDVCGEKVFQYEKCTSPYVYCSIDCVAILILSQQNGMIDENVPENNTFKIKRVNSQDDLMEIEEEDKHSVTSWWSVNHPLCCGIVSHSG